MKKRDIIESVIGLILLIVLAYFILESRVRQNLQFFWTDSYFYWIYIFLGLGFIFVLGKKYLKKYYPYLKYPYYILFLPIALFPALRCYFKVPYIFCNACPRKCPWGILRQYTIPSFVLMNLDCRSWCFKLCPFGTLQDYQSKATKKRICLPAWLKHIRWFFLAFSTFIVIASYYASTRGFFYTGNYDYVFWTLATAIIIFILAFFIPRFWCNYFCPIGAFGDLFLKAECRYKNYCASSKASSKDKR